MIQLYTTPIGIDEQMVFVDYGVHFENSIGLNFLTSEALSSHLGENGVGVIGAVVVPVAGEAPTGEGVFASGNQERSQGRGQVAERDGNFDPSAAQRGAGVVARSLVTQGRDEDERHTGEF